MRLRFLATTESQVPGYPFQAGQEIVVDEVTPEVRRWLKYSHAVAVREEPEIAIAPPVERAVARVAESFVLPVKPKRKGRA